MHAEARRWSPAAVRILRTAAELIALQGYSAASTRDIAAAVGVQQPAIYKHFSAKDDILAALVRLAVERPLELIDELAVLRVPAAVRLHRLLKDSLDHMRTLQYVLASILTTPELQQDRFAEEQELISRIDRAVIELIKTGQEEGDMRAMNPISAASLVQALFDTLAAPKVVVSPDEIVEFAMTALLTDPSRLTEIRCAANALKIETHRLDSET
ncbi:MAG: TetR/AcrR family transcriptional regulator [Mycobacterium sp.]